METTRRVPEIEIIVGPRGVHGWYATILIDGRAWQTTEPHETLMQARTAAESWLRERAAGHPALLAMLERYDLKRAAERPEFVAREVR